MDGAGPSAAQKAVLSHRWAQRPDLARPHRPTGHPPVLTQLRAAGRPGAETSRLVPGLLTRRHGGEGVAPAKARPQSLLSLNPSHALPGRPGAPGGVGGRRDDPADVQGGERGLQRVNHFTHTKAEKPLPCARRMDTAHPRPEQTSACHTRNAP